MQEPQWDRGADLQVTTGKVQAEDPWNLPYIRKELAALGLDWVAGQLATAPVGALSFGRS